MPTRMVEAGERAVELVRRSGTPGDLSGTLGITLFGWTYTGRFDLVEQNLPEIEAVSARTGDLQQHPPEHDQPYEVRKETNQT